MGNEDQNIVNTLSNFLRQKTGARNAQKFLTNNFNLAVQRGNASSVLRRANKKTSELQINTR